MTEPLRRACAAGHSLSPAYVSIERAMARCASPGPGVWEPPADKQAALATLRKAIELGVNLIDTADSYGPATSKELIADALYPYPSDLVIATKGGWERPGPNQ